MATIHFDVDDDLIHTLGAESLKIFLEKQVLLLKMRFAIQKMDEVAFETNVSISQLFEESRQAAWDEYRELYFKTT